MSVFRVSGLLKCFDSTFIDHIGWICSCFHNDGCVVMWFREGWSGTVKCNKCWSACITVIVVHVAGVCRSMPAVCCLLLKQFYFLVISRCLEYWLLSSFGICLGLQLVLHSTRVSVYFALDLGLLVAA